MLGLELNLYCTTVISIEWGAAHSFARRAVYTVSQARTPTFATDTVLELNV